MIVFLVVITAAALFRKMSMLTRVGCVLLLVLTISLLPFRNYLVTGNFKWLPTNGSFIGYVNLANSNSLQESTYAFFLYYIKKFLFCIWLLPVLESLFQARPHWLLLWLGIIIYAMKDIRISFNLHTYPLLFICMIMAVLVLIAPIQ